MPSKHAALSASSSKRWIECPPSAKINISRGDENPSEYAVEGTCAHSLAEYKVKTLLGIKAEDPTDALQFYDGEMEEAVEGYAGYVSECLERAKKEGAGYDAAAEQHLDMSRWIPEGFGTADAVVMSGETLRIIDLKYGAGIAVSAEENTQLMCYALGALYIYDRIYDVDTVILTIYQPRRDNISVWEISRDDLLAWGDEILKPAAEKAIKGGGLRKAGDHCRFCAVKATCRARAEQNMGIAKYDFEKPERLSDDEIEDVLKRADSFTSWISDVNTYALNAALKGKKWEHYKLVAGRSVRKYKDSALAAKAAEQAGYDPYEKKLLGITAMTKLMGKEAFNEVLGGLIIKPPGKLTLAPESDKRPAVDAATAEEDFMEEN